MIGFAFAFFLSVAVGAPQVPLMPSPSEGKALSKSRLRQEAELDELNEKQNNIREQVERTKGQLSEMRMALENLQLEMQQQESLREAEKSFFLLTFKWTYRQRRHGLLPFLISGESLSDVLQRLRWVRYIFLQRSQAAGKLVDRFQRLKDSRQKISDMRQESERVLIALQIREQELNEVLKRKKQLVRRVSQPKTDPIFPGANKTARLKLFADPRIAAAKPVFPVSEGHLLAGPKTAKGIEIGAQHQAPVRAILGGVVEYQGWIKGLGNVVLVKHPEGIYSLSAHLFKVLKPQGSVVEQGETIGLVGDTGFRDKPSLYFEVRKMGKPVDPLGLYPADVLAPFRAG